MLKVFRKYTKVIIWLVVGSFILWGGYSMSSLKKEDRYAGEAFGKPVSFQEYNQFYRATQIFMPSEQALDDPDLLRNYTWQNIIYSREAKRNNIKITDEEVRKEIASILKQQGLINPTPEQYKIWLTRALHLTPREFEEGLREFMRIQSLLRTKIAGFTPDGTDKLTDPKEKEAVAEKQKEDFMAWTHDVNTRAALRDYMPSPEAQDETPELEEAMPAVTPDAKAQTPSSGTQPGASVTENETA